MRANGTTRGTVSARAFEALLGLLHRLHQPGAGLVLDDGAGDGAEEASEPADARAVLATGADARARGEVAALDDQGRFVDPAVEARARVVLDRIPVEDGVDRDPKGQS